VQPRLRVTTLKSAFWFSILIKHNLTAKGSFWNEEKPRDDNSEESYFREKKLQKLSYLKRGDKR
jgi:hypothetical protein